MGIHLISAHQPPGPLVKWAASSTQPAKPPPHKSHAPIPLPPRARRRTPRACAREPSRRPARASATTAPRILPLRHGVRAQGRLHRRVGVARRRGAQAGRRAGRGGAHRWTTVLVPAGEGRRTEKGRRPAEKKRCRRKRSRAAAKLKRAHGRRRRGCSMGGGGGSPGAGASAEIAAMIGDRRREGMLRRSPIAAAACGCG